MYIYTYIHTAHICLLGGCMSVCSGRVAPCRSCTFMHTHTHTHSQDLEQALAASQEFARASAVNDVVVPVVVLAGMQGVRIYIHCHAATYIRLYDTLQTYLCWRHIRPSDTLQTHQTF